MTSITYKVKDAIYNTINLTGQLISQNENYLKPAALLL
jgi:hypothetical protein